MGQKDHNLTLEEMENGIIGSHGILAEVGRRIARLRRNQTAKDQGVEVNKIDIVPIGWDSVKRALEKYELKSSLDAEGECALDQTAFNMLDRAVNGDFDAEKFVLDRKGKDRGWGKEKTVNHKGSTVTVNISKAEDGV